MLLKKIVVIVFLFSVITGISQEKEVMNASMTSSSTYMREVGPLVGKTLVPEKPRKGNINPRRIDANKVVPGKGLPFGKDPLLTQQKNSVIVRANKAPSLTFEANASASAPTDPTGAIGPNHYVSAKNSAFAIHDRAGVELVASSSLENIFPGESLGDPIVFYDSFADRFVITQFSDTPNGFLVAVGKGPDPVNDGWYTYRFDTGSFPDYTKFSIWSDGYYITANKDQGSQATSEVVYVIDRTRMLQGKEDVKMVGFPLPGARIGGFYSPAGFNAIGNTLPPEGDARIVYFQDDGWEGVSEDALKLWTINVDWFNLEASTITESEEFTVGSGAINSFDNTFDGGSFGNIPQPGTEGQDIDVLQGAVMYASNYRRFCDYNAVVLNFAVDIDDRTDTAGGDLDNIAGIRWYELRQTADGQPWTVYQEGTYTSPDGKSAWCASMAMDVFGNIGMGYTTMGTTDNGATADSFGSIRYTGRLATDPLGTMTFAEQTIATGSAINITQRNRYGDYAQLTVDPADDRTFWHIAEYFEDTGDNARNIVGVFKIGDDPTNDVGITKVDQPIDAILTNAEIITVTLKNFGATAQSDIPVSYSINGGAAVIEVFAGPLNAGETASFSFATAADLTADREYTITAETNLTGDTFPENDCAMQSVKNLFSSDTGVIDLVSPQVGDQLTSEEEITITIFNFGGTEQSNIPVSYTINGGTPVNEVFTGTLAPRESVSYTFTTTADLQTFGEYSFQIGTALAGDQDDSNDAVTRTIIYEFCRPTANCSRFRDGIISFELANVSNTPIGCSSSGYVDFTSDFEINLSKSVSEYTVTVQSGFANDSGAERFSLWIDFNDNSIFEETELLLDNRIISVSDTDQDFTLSLPPDAALGSHLLRIRGGDTNTNSGAPLNDPCGSMEFGTTHDYTVVISEEVIAPVPDTELLVISQPENQFVITKIEANAPAELRIYIFNILGGVVASNLLKKDGRNTFTYELDMSFARSGVYFARLGDNKSDAQGFFVR